MSKQDYTEINSLIVRYLGGNASKDEIHELESWVRECDDNEAYFRQMKNIWEISEELPISTENALDSVMKHISPRSNGLSFWYYWQRVAAILLIPLLIITLWFGLNGSSKSADSEPVYHKVTSAFGTFSKMELPDGSKVWLNAGSSLEYPDKFNNTSRTVNLVGEAYFEVESNTQSPFYVNTPSITVKATGTRFNVVAYKEYTASTVTLVEGKVAVLKSPNDKKENLITVLRPQQHMKYDASTEQVNISSEDTYKHIAWKDGKLVFRNDLLTDVARKIGQQYNVEIEIVGDQIKNYRFRATFENESLSELLRLLKISTPIDYREINSELLPDGSFSRRKIIIFSK